MKKVYSEIITNIKAAQFVRDLGYGCWSVPGKSKVICTVIERADAPTLMGMLKEAGFASRYA